MGTVVDICNLALGSLGDRANLTSIDPPEGSAQADHCARFWPIARDEALAAQDWTWASTWVDGLAALDVEHPIWTYVYTLPADCLIVRELRYSSGAVALLDPRNPQFEMSTAASGQLALLTHADVVAMRYTRRVTDPTKYSPTFTSAVIMLLASYLAGPVIKGKAGVQTKQAHYIAYRTILGEAGVIDGNQNSQRQQHTPDSMRARGYGGRETIIERGQERISLPFWAQP